VRAVRELKSRAVVVTDYEAQDEGEISLVKDEVLLVYEIDDEEGWCTGVSETNKQRYGLFPLANICVTGPIVSPRIEESGEDTEEGEGEDGEDDGEGEERRDPKNKKGRDTAVEETDFAIHLTLDEDSDEEDEGGNARIERRRKEKEEQEKYLKENEDLFEKRRQELAKARGEAESQLDKTLHKMTIKSTDFSISLAIDDESDEELRANLEQKKEKRKEKQMLEEEEEEEEDKKKESEEALLERRRAELRKQRDVDVNKNEEEEDNMHAGYSISASLDNESEDQHDKPVSPRSPRVLAEPTKEPTKPLHEGEEKLDAADPKSQEFLSFIYAKTDKKEQEEKHKEELSEKKAALKAEYAKKKIEDKYNNDGIPAILPSSSSGKLPVKKKKISSKKKEDGGVSKKYEGTKKTSGIFGSSKVKTNTDNHKKKKTDKPQSKHSGNDSKKPSGKKKKKKHAPKVPKSLSSEESASVLLHYKLADQETNNDGESARDAGGLPPLTKAERRLTKGRPPRPPGTNDDPHPNDKGVWKAVKCTPGGSTKQPKMGTRT